MSAPSTFGELSLVQEEGGGVSLFVVPKLLSPGPLHPGKESHIQWGCILSVAMGEAHKLDVVLLTGDNDLSGEVAGQVIPDQHFFARQAAGNRQVVLEKPVLADGLVKPA